MPEKRSIKTFHHITKNDLLLLLDKSSFEILQELNRINFGFINCLEKCSYRQNDEAQTLEILVKILSQVCSLKGQKNMARLNRLLRMLKDCQEFLFNDIPRVINSCFQQASSINLPSFMADYMSILTTLLSKDFFPCERIVNEILPTIENYMNRLREKRFRNIELVEACFNDLVRKKEFYENPVSDEDDDQEINCFRKLPVVPHKDDIVNYEIPYIPHNIVDRPYKSVDHYLSVHYRLTREDMLRSFRDCVKVCMESKGHGISSLNRNHFYENVSIVSSPKYTVEGIFYDIKVTSSKAIDWAKKEFLVPGSLVILTPDLLNTVVVATVKNNPRSSVSKSKECTIKIKLEDDLFIDELSAQDYVMIEPDAYFECYKHILSAIKAFSETSFPLSDIISYLNFDDVEPEYLEGKSYCLHEKCGSLNNHDDSHDCKTFNPLKDDEWPESDDLKLDEQQYLAFKTAITKKVAVLQGPPGTGKTYVGEKVVKALLENTPHKPIIICCWTNHALDQFLERMMVHTNKIVRLGSQSQSKMLEPHQINNLIYAVKQFNLQNNLDKDQQKSLNIVKDIANIVLNEKFIIDYEPEVYQIKDLCEKINANLVQISLCNDSYLQDSALNDIIGSKYKDQLRNKSGSIEKSLGSSVLEWLVCSRSNDLYDKCCKYFSYFEKKQVIPSKFQDVWDLHETKRFELFYCWRKNCLKIRTNHLLYDVEKYRILMSKYRTQPVDPLKLEIMKGAFIIGVTTTGAGKFKDLIRLSQPAILLIEEAAQVLESHVIASLVPSIQHLVLIGDHEQLRPLPNNFELSEKYNLKISMFERLFRNGAPSATLVSQHRMKPCIAELLVPRPYTHYTSYSNVYEYEEIRGVQSSVFFFDHRKFEDSNSSGTSSSNEFEAQIIVSLAKYFYVQNYSLNKLTILATYAAQVRLIRDYLLLENLEAIHVTTVDNFQGEENDIILLSFVRSNSSSILGFLKESNRVCVALSRAKKGMFCFGNFELFSNKNDLWKGIVEKARAKNMIGDSLMLKCDRHQTIHSAKCKEDIEGFIGGCSELCNFLLLCNHRCAHTCHFKDPDHLHYSCKQPCERMIDENRVCPRLCYERCKRIKKKEIELPCGHFGSAGNSMCFKEVQRVLPCQHVITIHCYLSIQRHKCKASVKVDLDCGHVKTILCHELEEKINIICTELKPELGACGHNVNVPCSLNLDENELILFCNKSCGSLLDCGHPCVRFCRWCFDTGIHGLCPEKCEQRLACGHKCDGDCNRPCPPCKQKCFLSCVHRTTCINDCLRTCVKCEEPCSRVCKHVRCSKKCFEECDVEPCLMPCYEVLGCGHRCIGICGDPCPNMCRICHIDDFNADVTEDCLYVELECEHVIEVNQLNEHIKDCMISFDWPCCPECSKVITQSARYKKTLMNAKKLCIDSCDTFKDVSDIQYLVETMYGEDYNPPAMFLPVHRRIMQILKKKNPQSDSLIVLKYCVISLKKLVVIAPKLLFLSDVCMQEKFDTLLIWISDHLTIASLQQLRELESAVELLSNKI